VQAIANGGLGSLHNEGVNVLLQRLAKLSGPLKFRSNDWAFHAKAFPRDLHESPAGAALGAEDERETDNSVPSGNSHFDGSSVADGQHSGCNAIFKKIEMSVIAVLEDFVPGQIDGREMGFKAVDFRLRQRRKNSIFVGRFGWIHAGSYAGITPHLDAQMNRPLGGKMCV
jgi:hypothetical protein